MRRLDRPEEICAFDHQVVKPYYLLLDKPKSAMKDQWDYIDIVASGSYPRPARLERVQAELAGRTRRASPGRRSARNARVI